jgi:hypothetical protein
VRLASGFSMRLAVDWLTLSLFASSF